MRDAIVLLFLLLVIAFPVSALLILLLGDLPALIICTILIVGLFVLHTRGLNPERTTQFTWQNFRQGKGWQ